MLTFMQWQELNLEPFDHSLQLSLIDYQRCKKTYTFCNFEFETLRIDLLALGLKLHPLEIGGKSEFTPFIRHLIQQIHNLEQQSHYPIPQPSTPLFYQIKNQLLRLLMDYQWFLRYLRTLKHTDCQMVLLKMAELVKVPSLNGDFKTGFVKLTNQNYQRGISAEVLFDFDQ